jgi:dolichyl-phosphate beta-glucosyltransferase
MRPSIQPPPENRTVIPSVWLVIPCFRESTRIGRFLSSLSTSLGQRPEIAILPVDDGSGGEEPAALRAVVESHQDTFPNLLSPLELTHNRGKGGAVYAGWNAAPASVSTLAFVDADGAVPAHEVLRLIDLATLDSSQAVFASRIRMLGRTVERVYARHLVGRVFATLVATALDLPVYDSQCGCKLIPSTAFEKVRPLLVEYGFAFDVELLAALTHAGIKVIELPIDWQEVPGGKVKFLSDPIRMAISIAKIRRRRRSWHTAP